PNVIFLTSSMPRGSRTCVLKRSITRALNCLASIVVGFPERTRLSLDTWAAAWALEPQSRAPALRAQRDSLRSRWTVNTNLLDESAMASVRVPVENAQDSPHRSAAASWHGHDGSANPLRPRRLPPRHAPRAPRTGPFA